MTKKDLIAGIAKKTGITQVFVDAVIGEFVKCINAEEKLVIQGLGTFKHVVRAAHTARNPITGAPVSVPEKIVLKFKQAK